MVLLEGRACFVPHYFVLGLQPTALDHRSSVPPLGVSKFETLHWRKDMDESNCVLTSVNASKAIANHPEVYHRLLQTIKIWVGYCIIVLLALFSLKVEVPIHFRISGLEQTPTICSGRDAAALLESQEALISPFSWCGPSMSYPS